MQGLRAALEQRDAATLRRLAHAVKGAVDSCGASAAFDAAMLLERIGTAGGSLAGGAAALAVLDQRLESARVELGEYLARDAALARAPRAGADQVEGGQA
jgi:HPt (histidine-containing phosphotransfer) domain-containing protein